MNRYCPVCDASMSEMHCPIHHVPTVSEASFSMAAAHISVGDLVEDQYRVISILGSGSMGTVYTVEDREGARWALKVIKVRDDASRQIVKRFYREALAVSKLDHPGIVKIERFAVDERSGLPFQTMEFVEGQTLYDYVSHGDRSVAVCIEVISQLLDALQHAHELGIVHRDLKPENVMVLPNADGSLCIKVLDFGIAKILEHEGDAPTLTATGVAVGTPYYMSPEQAKGESVTPRSDLYSVGCLLYEMLVDSPPFVGDDFMSILISHVRSPIPEVPETSIQGETIPTNVRASIRQSLAKKTGGRQQTALEMKHQLMKLSEPEPIESDVRRTQGVQSAGTDPEDGRKVDGAADTIVLNVKGSGSNVVKYVLGITVLSLLAALAFLSI